MTSSTGDWRDDPELNYITQHLLEIAEGEWPLDEWNGHMTRLYALIGQLLATQRSELAKSEDETRAKALMDAMAVLHKHAMGTRDLNVLDAIEAIQHEVLSLLNNK